MAESLTSRESGPTLDAGPVTTAPSIETRRALGKKPKTPLRAAGRRIEPPSSEPIEIGTSPAATPAPDPPLDAPQVRDRSHGFPHSLDTRFTDRPQEENSGRLALPNNMPPAAFMRSTATASRVGTNVSKSNEATVVRTPAVKRLSFAV